MVDDDPEPRVISGIGRPMLRRIFVAEAYRLTANMQRVMFEGRDLEGYQFYRKSFGPFVKLLIPPAHRNGNFVWPVFSNGHLIWPTDVERPAVRTYTVRDFDADRRKLTIDFVLHLPEGPASAFARHARPGQEIAMLDRGFCMPVNFERYLLVGDHSALPAIAQIIENSREPDRIQAIAALEHPDDRIAFSTGPASSVSWIVEQSDERRLSIILADVERRLTTLQGDCYLWAGGEVALTAAVRDFARLRGVQQTHILKYWRRGFNEEGVPVSSAISNL